MAAVRIQLSLAGTHLGLSFSYWWRKSILIVLTGNEDVRLQTVQILRRLKNNKMGYEVAFKMN